MNKLKEIQAIIKEVFADFGREGGKSKSKAKTIASRKNGKLGGRPKKKVQD